MSADALTQISSAVIAALSAWIVAHYTIIRSAKKDANERLEQRERDARYLAIRVVCQLDPFIYACCGVATDEGRPNTDGYFEPTSSTPNIVLPTDGDWRSLNPEMMYRVLSLPNDIDAANLSVSAAMEHVAAPPEFSEYFLRRRTAYAQLGLCALALADDLRKQFSIPAREDRDEDPEAHLNHASSKALRDELLASSMGDFVRHRETEAALKLAGVKFDISP